MSRCEHHSKGSWSPGPSQGQCFTRKTERSRGARRRAGQSAARARGEEVAVAVDGCPLAQPPSENSQPRSSSETRPAWPVFTSPIISTFWTLLRGPLHPHPTSISESVSYRFYARVLPLPHESELVSPLFKPSTGFRLKTKPDSDDLTPCLPPRFLPHPPLLTLLQPPGPPFCS